MIPRPRMDSLVTQMIHVSIHTQRRLVPGIQVPRFRVGRSCELKDAARPGWIYVGQRQVGSRPCQTNTSCRMGDNDNGRAGTVGKSPVQ